MKSSDKKVLNTLLKKTTFDARSLTGENLRNIAKEVNIWPISNLSPHDADMLEYFPPKAEDRWVLEALDEVLMPGEDIAALPIDEREFLDCLYTG